MKPLTDIWPRANLPCYKRLKAILPLCRPGYIQQFGNLPAEVIRTLHAISPATPDRLFKPVKAKYKGRGRTATKPGTLLRKQIPIKTNQWDESRPGFLEADTVAHCGNSLSGMFAYTIDGVDIATGWSDIPDDSTFPDIHSECILRLSDADIRHISLLVIVLVKVLFFIKHPYRFHSTCNILSPRPRPAHRGPHHSL